MEFYNKIESHEKWLTTKRLLRLKTLVANDDFPAFGMMICCLLCLLFVAMAKHTFILQYNHLNAAFAPTG